MVHGLRERFDLSILLEAANIARSSFYYYMKRNKAVDKYQAIRIRIIELYRQHKGRYGYRRMLFQLKKEGHKVNHKTVLRLTGEMGLKSIVRPKKYRSYRGEEGRTAPNMLSRKFNAGRPFEKLATDVTEFSVAGKKLYLSPIIDLFNGEVISYSQSLRPDFRQITEMLVGVLKKVPKDAKPILHSDQGWQYRMKDYQDILRKNRIVQSMSRKGNCLDNAVIENFFGTLKSEMFYIKKYLSVEELQNDIDDYIDYYNNNRIRLNLKGMSPVEYRAHILNN
ncbi:IS3 family transposase [Nubsella zeaxanthinifaciens]|uniref:IS3 family transposase n=1 Tax=Nubsella zeaxanthinifaciens TaxID=392412 RepID=UPI001EEE0BCE|nr:IS3 family transposase [Nubsella zeaxanthinifaciens]